MPLVGVVAYILFGEVRMRSAEKSTMARVRQHLSGLWQPSPEVVRKPPRWPRRWWRQIRPSAAFMRSPETTPPCWPRMTSAIADLVAAIDDAQVHVHMLFYIWLDDASGRSVAEAAIRAAGRGVKVRAVIDAFGSRAFGRSDVWARMRAASCRCVEALPLGMPVIGLLFQRMDLRNHRKIVIIDNDLGFTGSRNCSDRAFAVKPRFAPWVDIFLRIQGPVVRQMQAIFAGLDELYRRGSGRHAVHGAPGRERPAKSRRSWPPDPTAATDRFRTA